MKQLVLISSILFLNTIASAKTLECNDAPSYAGRSFTINRDGAIGFNGTYIEMQADTAWATGKNMLISLDKITGRAQDQKYKIKHITLAISPKSACTNPNASVTTPFTCAANDVSVIARGETYEGSHNGEQDVSDVVSVRSQLRGRVEVELAPVANSPYAKLVLKAKINTAKNQVVEVEIPVKDAKNCVITGRDVVN